MNRKKKVIQSGWDRLWVMFTAGWGVYLGYDMLQLGPTQKNELQSLFGSLWVLYFFALLLGWAAIGIVVKSVEWVVIGFRKVD